jgi:hypothetical protein
LFAKCVRRKVDNDNGKRQSFNGKKGKEQKRFSQMAIEPREQTSLMVDSFFSHAGVARDKVGDVQD